MLHQGKIPALSFQPSLCSIRSQSSLCPSDLILLECSELSLITATFPPSPSSPLPKVKAFFLSFLIQIHKYSYYECVKGFQEMACGVVSGAGCSQSVTISCYCAGRRGRIWERRDAPDRATTHRLLRRDQNNNPSKY